MAADRPLTIGGVPLAERVRLAADLVNGILAELLDKIPAYRALPPEELAGDTARSVKSAIRMCATVMERRRMPTDREMEELLRHIAIRAEEGMPLEAMLSAVQMGSRTGWDLITAEAGPDDVADLRIAAGLMMDYIRTIIVATTETYLAERGSLVDQEQLAQKTLLSALLNGDKAVQEVARRVGLPLSGGYTVLEVIISSHPDESRPAIEPAVAARRKLRRVRAELLALGGTALAVLGPDGGTVLAPEEVGRDRLDTLLARMNQAAGVPVTAAAAYAPIAGVPAAARQVHEVLDVVLASGRPPGVYELEDVLLEYQLTRPGAARIRLAGLLDPIAGQAELLDTLEIHLTNDLNRRRTADRLSVHPNTVDYRMRRIAQLTGLDPTRPMELQKLSAALTALRAEKAPSNGGPLVSGNNHR